MLILAFDTATDVASTALVRDGELLGERRSRAVSVLVDAHELLAAAGAEPADLDALAAGAPGAIPVIDARRREVFTLLDGPRCLRPEELDPEPGTMYVGDGALRYRSLLEQAGAEVPPAESELHVPRAHLHARLARDFGPAELVEPIYLRLPDAERALAR